jgi:hypothetical protein
MLRAALAAISCSLAASGLSISTSTAQQRRHHHVLNRRSAIIATSISLPTLFTSNAAYSATDSNPVISAPNPRAITTIDINSPNQSAGLELYTVQIGTPRRNVVAVLSVRPNGLGAKFGVQKGMILLDFTKIEDVLKRISNGPYPIELRLYNLALGGDAVGDLGRSIVTPENALELAQSVSGGRSNISNSDIIKQSNGLVINTIKKANGECAMQSRRGDTMQIRYEARIGDKNGPVYDSNSSRGTGQPYAYSLGNNDVIKGVDLGTYDMCPGEIRELSIPPELGYPNGSKLFRQIPPHSELFWRVELVEVNFVTEGNNDRPREGLY